MMKYLSVFALLGCVFTCGSAQAALSGTCGTASLGVYTSGGSCTIGDKSFGGFAAVLTAVTVGGTATPSSLNDITVVPSGSSSNPGFSFQAAYDASGLIASDTLTLLYTGMAPQNDPFTGATMSLSGASVNGAALITAAEALCKNGGFGDIHLAIPPVCSTGIGVNALLLSQITNANLNAIVQFNFAPVTELGVLKQITLTGAIEGTASATALNNGYTATATPEPSSWVLVGFALPALAFCKRRLRRNS